MVLDNRKTLSPARMLCQKMQPPKNSKRLIEHEISLLCSPLLSLTLNQSDTKPVRTVTTDFFTIRFNFAFHSIIGLQRHTSHSASQYKNGTKIPHIFHMSRVSVCLVAEDANCYFPLRTVFIFA